MAPSAPSPGHVTVRTDGFTFTSLARRVTLLWECRLSWPLSICTTEGLLSKSLLVTNDTSNLLDLQTLTNFNTLTTLTPGKDHWHIDTFQTMVDLAKSALVSRFTTPFTLHRTLVFTFMKRRGDTAEPLAFCGRHLLFDFPVSQPPNLGSLRNGRIGIEKREISEAQRNLKPRDDDFAPVSCVE